MLVGITGIMIIKKSYGKTIMKYIFFVFMYNKHQPN